MRKLLCFVLMLMLTAAAVPACAEEIYTIAGFDHQDTGHVWTENLFFQRMEKITGVQLDVNGGMYMG